MTGLIAELIDAKVYPLWMEGRKAAWPQWAQVAVSNYISIPMESPLFPIIAIAGVLAGYLLLLPTGTVRILFFLPPFSRIARIPALFFISLWFII